MDLVRLRWLRVTVSADSSRHGGLGPPAVPMPQCRGLLRVSSFGRDRAWWLPRLGFRGYATSFAKNEITPEVLPSLSDADLKELGPMGNLQYSGTAVPHWP